MAIRLKYGNVYLYEAGFIIYYVRASLGKRRSL
jgi:hypothetical protein